MKKAFDYPERREPSMTKTFSTGKSTDRAYDKIRSFSSPACSGTNLLKIGMIQVGAISWIRRIKTVVTPQAESQAPTPPETKKTNNNTKKKPPRSTPRRSPFTRSAAKRDG